MQRKQLLFALLLPFAMTFGEPPSATPAESIRLPFLKVRQSTVNGGRPSQTGHKF